MKFFATALIFCGVIAAQAQAPVVPHKLNFAGMSLTIRDDARQEIQKDVDALTQSPKYFMIKVERARTYFPIIEKIFAEERVPDDFKFLCLQESALIADAVSVSDAVGFWQFKDFTAREVGLRVDSEVDERMNIASSSRGAARYIKQNNFMFNNWVYALQAYQMGAGGVKRTVGDSHDGSRHMEITSDTYWYVKKFLAHKIAFQEAVGAAPQTKVTAFPVSSGSSLTDLAEATSTDLARLQEYNKWVRKGTIPSDKEYFVIVPTGTFDQDFTKLLVNNTPRKEEEKQPEEKKSESTLTLINDVPAIQALSGETLSALAKRANVEVTQLAKYNEVAIDHRVVPGAFYFTDKKKHKALEDYHHVADGENLWKISQMYGVQVKRLRKYNKLSEGDKLTKGAVVWLSSNKPQDEVFTNDTESVLEVEQNETFDWSLKETKSENLEKDQAANMHIVQAGETLYSIAKTHNIPIKELQEKNQLELAQGLRVGQSLKLIDNEIITKEETQASSVSETVHEVQSSETLYSVARQYGVTIKALMDWNEKTELTVSVGEKLRIPAR